MNRRGLGKRGVEESCRMGRKGVRGRRGEVVKKGEVVERCV